MGQTWRVGLLSRTPPSVLEPLDAVCRSCLKQSTQEHSWSLEEQSCSASEAQPQASECLGSFPHGSISCFCSKRCSKRPHEGGDMVVFMPCSVCAPSSKGRRIQPIPHISDWEMDPWSRCWGVKPMGSADVMGTLEHENVIW